MESPKDIYHKADSSIPPRRLGRKMTEPVFKTPPPSPPPSSAAQPVGTQSIGAPISPIQIARQQMQMQPQQRHLRRRRRRSDTEHEARRKNRLIWILVGLVVMAYVSILALSVLKGRLNRPAKGGSPPSAAAAARPKPDPARIETGPAGAPGLPVAERVQKWSKGARLLEETSTLINNARFPQAREKLVQAGDLVPNSLDYKLGMARVCMSEHNFRDAEKLLVQAVDANPNNAEAREMLARALLENGRNADALAVAEWVCLADAYSEAGHDVAATALLAPEVNDVAKAVEHLKKLMNLRSDDQSVRNSLGKAYLRLGNVYEARKVFDEILRADDQNFQAYYNLAGTLVREGRAEDAVSTLSRAASKLGESFVAPWLNNPDFDSIRKNPDFVALERRLAAAAAESVPANRQPATKP